MAKVKKTPATFIREVKSETKKVTWPSGRETFVSIVAVFIMVFFFSLFLYFADQVIAYLVRLVMGLGM